MQGKSIPDGQVEIEYQKLLDILATTSETELVITNILYLDRIRTGIATGEIVDNVVVIWPDDSEVSINKYGRMETFHPVANYHSDTLMKMLEAAINTRRKERSG